MPATPDPPQISETSAAPGTQPVPIAPTEPAEFAVPTVPMWLEPLTAAEQRLWNAFPHGETVVYATGVSDLDDPSNSADWGMERTIRAAVVAALALGASRAEPGRTAGVRIVGARIVGQLELRHGIVDVPLTLRRCRVEGTIRVDEAVTRSIDLTGSHIGRLRAEGTRVRGSLKLADTVAEIPSGSAVSGSRGGPGAPGSATGEESYALSSTPRTSARFEEGLLHLDEITIDTDLSAPRLRCDGTVSLIGANIGAVLDLYEARISRPWQVALNLGGARIGRQLLAGSAVFRGQVRMPSTYCGGVVHFSRAAITETSHTALTAEGFTGEGDGYFQHGFRAEGGVALIGARFGGVLSFRGAHLGPAKSFPVLHCGGMLVSRGLYLNGGFYAEGEVRLIGATINGHLDLTGMAKVCGPLTLYHASIATIRDNGPRTWPSEVLLDGLTYNSFDPYLPAEERLDLLRRQRHGYRAQPYEFMAAYYHELGHDEDARAILLEKERARRSTDRLGERLLGRAFDLLVGYGYRPMRAIAYGAVIQVVASIFFFLDPPSQIRPEDHVAFYPVLYAADVFVPIVHFGQSDEFQSHGLAAVVATVLPYLGWALGLSIVAGASRVLSRGFADRR